MLCLFSFYTSFSFCSNYSKFIYFVKLNFLCARNRERKERKNCHIEKGIRKKRTNGGLKNRGKGKEKNGQNNSFEGSFAKSLMRGNIKLWDRWKAGVNDALNERLGKEEVKIWERGVI